MATGEHYIWFCATCKVREVTLTARPMTAHFGGKFTEGLWCKVCDKPMLPLPARKPLPEFVTEGRPTMRLVVNEDESASFRRALLEEINAGADKIPITLTLDRDDALNILANSRDDQPLQCVWACAITRNK